MENTTGTYISVKPTPATLALLKEWAVVQGITLNDDLHVTLLYSRKEVKTTQLSTEYFATPIKFEQFDDGYLVIVLDSPTLNRRHEYFMSIGGTHDYETYTPHLSIQKGSKVNINELELPNFGMMFWHEMIEPLDVTR
jgi:hypothetical protein